MIDRAEAVSRQVDILRSTGELSPTELEAIGIRLQEYADEAAEPVFIRVLLGLGGWFCAISLMLAIQLILQGKGLLPGGVAMLVLAVGVARAGRGTFLSQLASAFAFVGNAGILGGAATIGGNALAALSTLQLFLTLILYPLLSYPSFRFAASISVAALAIAWVVEIETLWLFHLLVAAELGLFITLNVRKRRLPAFFPLENAVALLLPATLLVFYLSRILLPAPSAEAALWPSGFLVCGGLVALLFHPSFLPHLKLSWKFSLSAAFLFFGLSTSPGVPVALILLILGRARGERYLTILGGLFLPVFLGFYFHALDIDPLYKAWAIAGSGLLLLWVRRLAAHLRSGEES